MKRITGKCIQCTKRTQGKGENGFLCRNCRQQLEYTELTDRLTDMDQYDFGWLVGLIEGEGCFYCKESNCQISSGQYCYPLAGFTLMSTDKDIMNRFGDLLGVEPRGPYYKKSKKERKVVWSVQITGNRAIAIMNTLHPHLGERRQEQINKALEWQNKGRFKIA